MIPDHMLNDGHQLPAIGFGTYPLRGRSGIEALVSALHQGYRLIDSAVNYRNEEEVGEAIRRSGVPREEIVVTTKLPGRHHAHDQAVACVHDSLQRLGLDSIDLYLIHWPNPRIDRYVEAWLGLDSIDLYLIHWPNPRIDRYVEAWQALVDVQREGLVRSIGVSNFLPEHLDRVIAATGVTPAVNQVELHPYFPQIDQREADARRGILTESWSPLARAGELFAEREVAAIAEAVGRTPAQVVLRWHHQLGAVPLPKAADPRRQAENLAIFDFTLDEAQVAALTALAREDGRIFDADPLTNEEL